jgi:hypothetical protein
MLGRAFPSLNLPVGFWLLGRDFRYLPLFQPKLPWERVPQRFRLFDGHLVGIGLKPFTLSNTTVAIDAV